MVDMSVTEMASGMIFMIYVVICAVSDLRTRTVSLRFSLVAAAAGVAAAIAETPAADSGTASWVALRAAGACPGIVIVMISLLSRGAIGPGDGVFIAVCGLFIGIGGTLIILTTALMLAGIWGLIVIAGRVLGGGYGASGSPLRGTSSDSGSRSGRAAPGRVRPKCRSTHDGIPFVTLAAVIIILMKIGDLYVRV